MLRKTMLQWLNAAFVLSLITFSIFILAIPFFITELNSLELELELEIQETTKLVDRLWSEISNRNTNRYPRSTYDETADNIKSYVGPPSYSDAKPPSLPYTIPKYGYGYRKLKCCCSIDGYVSTNLPTSYKCPAGPPGPRGRKGYSGEDGTPGQPGLNGQNFFATVPNSYSYERPPAPPIPCAPCPCGPPGPPGPPGAMGLQGRKGVRGACGIPGFHGKPGEYGEPGDLGKRGRRGVPGYKGTPGSDGVLACKGAPGLPGVPGPSGACGPRGVEGSPGEFGLPGPAGACGMPGPAGMPGVNGIDGPPGREGKPGRDAEYCSCPPKEHSINIQPVASLQKPEKASTIYTGGDVSVAIPPRPTYTTISPDHSSSPSSAYRQQNQQRLKRIKETLQTRFIDWPTRNFNNIMMKHNEKDYGLERNLPGERKHLY